MQVAQLCPTLCDPMDYTAHGILQARVLEWVAFPCSRGSSQPRDRTQVSHMQADSLPTELSGKPPNSEKPITNTKRFTVDIVTHYVTYYDTNTFETLTYMRTIKSFTVSFAKR